jgi:hypothetical protein
VSRVACQLVEQKRRKRYPGRVGRGAFSLVFLSPITTHFLCTLAVSSSTSTCYHALHLFPPYIIIACFPTLLCRHLLDPLNLLGVLQALRQGRVSILPAILDVHICNLSSSVSHTSRRNACMPHGTITEPNVKYYTCVSSQYAIALLEIM